MAYHLTQERSPFIDTNLQSSLEKRVVEFLGLVLMSLSILIRMMVWSYSPEDPSWLSANDAPIQNMLGVYGASFAAPIVLILGWSSWAFASLTAVWGIRCIFHKGAEKALWRLVFVPFSLQAFISYVPNIYLN